MIVDMDVRTRMEAALARFSGLSAANGVEKKLLAALQGRDDQSFSGSFSSALLGTTINDLLVASFEALDLLNIGLVVCDADSRVLIANNTAHHILNRRDGLEIDIDGSLRCTSEVSPALGELIAKVAGADKSAREIAPEAAVSVPRGSERRALTLLVRPVVGNSNALPQSQQAAALVMIVDAARPVQTTAGELRQLYGLTSTEARLANLLMEGKDLDECCDALKIRRSTVRMHRRNLFSKTGVRRQTELVALLMKSIGLGPRDK